MCVSVSDVLFEDELKGLQINIVGSCDEVTVHQERADVLSHFFYVGFTCDGDRTIVDINSLCSGNAY